MKEEKEKKRQQPEQQLETAAGTIFGKEYKKHKKNKMTLTKQPQWKGMRKTDKLLAMAFKYMTADRTKRNAINPNNPVQPSRNTNFKIRGGKI